MSFNENMLTRKTVTKYLMPLHIIPRTNLAWTNDLCLLIWMIILALDSLTISKTTPCDNVIYLISNEVYIGIFIHDRYSFIAMNVLKLGLYMLLDNERHDRLTKNLWQKPRMYLNATYWWNAVKKSQYFLESCEGFLCSVLTVSRPLDSQDGFDSTPGIAYHTPGPGCPGMANRDTLYPHIARLAGEYSLDGCIETSLITDYSL